MPTTLRRRLRLARRYTAYTCALVLVAVALVVGAASQLLPLAERHPQQVAAWLSERAGRPVRFDQLDAQWTRRGPLLLLKGLRIGPGEGVRIGDAEVLLAMYSGLLPGRSLTELRLRGPVLTLLRADDGAWSVQGLPTNVGSDPIESLRRLGELQVIGGRLQVRAPSLGLDATLPRVDLRVRVNGSRLQVGSRSWIDPQRASLLGVFDFDRHRGDGTAYLEAVPADLGAWTPLLHAAGVKVRGGEGELRVWARLQDHRVAAVSVVADLRALALEGAALVGRAAPPTLNWDHLQVRARWVQVADGWRLVIPTLQFGSGAMRQTLDGVAIAGGRRFAVATGEVDASQAIAALALSDRLEPRLRRWLVDAHPQLRLSELTVSGEPDGPLQVQGRLAELGFVPVGTAPGISGLQGRFDGDAQGMELQFEPKATLRFNWPSGFGVVHELHLAGQVVGWRDGAGWQIATPALRLQATNYAADVRGGLWFQNNGRLPRINLAATLDDAPVAVAKKFWVHSEMSKAAIDWLDAALAGGTLYGGVGLVSGDLDDWPFDHHDGRFEATGHLRDSVIRFQPDWPQMEKLNGDVAFIGNGFSVRGNGSLAGVAVEHIEAGIPDFKEDALYVRANSHADATALLEMLRRSPLQKTYGDTLSNLNASGPAATTFDMLLPLNSNHGQGHLGGDIDLNGVKLGDKRWDLAFDQVRGGAHYSDRGFAADGLSVLHRGRPGRLSLRAGDAVQDPQQAFQADFVATLDARELFDRAPQMNWLQPYVHGTSQWRIGVGLPKVEPGSPEEPSHLTLDSDLVGTTLDLPAPLDKTPDRSLATHVDVALPFGDGDIDVAFGELVALKAATQNGQTGVRVVMGSDSVRERPPAHGLVVSGRTPSLDAIDWIALTRSGDSNSEQADAMPLQQIDVQADRLLLLGGVFPDTRLRLRPVRDAISVTLDGPSLSGQLDVPNADGAVLRGDLKTVHWQPAEPVEPAAAQTTPTATVPGPLADNLPEPARMAVADFDPSTIPPLSLDIADLQFGNARLGNAVLRTSRLSDGMQVDQLQLRSSKQKIAVTGAWRGKGDAASTRLSVRVTSEDLGALLQNPDLSSQLRGGEGQIEANVGWKGTPAAFQLASLQGNLKLDARNGQLLEVEPGAGRVLGLLSVAQLPRRLMFDFRDFFSKGLAFNRIHGEVLFGDGLARTDGIRMEGPAVDIDMRGQADLRKETFDQTVDVYPKSGNLLTVVGAVAAGPVGAAVGAAANAVLAKPLGEIGAKTYHVSGPWKEPKVEVVDRQEARKDRQADSQADKSGSH